MNNIDYRNIAVVKTIEHLSNYLAKNDKLIIDFFDFHNKDFLFFLHVFNNFKSSIFTHHDYIYIKMTRWKYFINRKKCNHFNIKRISSKDIQAQTSKILPIYKLLGEVTNEMEKKYPYIDLSNVISEAYDDYYYDGDKKYVRNLY